MRTPNRQTVSVQTVCDCGHSLNRHSLKGDVARVTMNTTDKATISVRPMQTGAIRLNLHRFTDVLIKLMFPFIGFMG
jgi:hypothetical protein